MVLGLGTALECVDTPRDTSLLLSVVQEAAETEGKDMKQVRRWNLGESGGGEVRSKYVVWELI